MENQKLIKQVTERAQQWLTPAYDAETQAEVKRMLDNPDKTELIECFYRDLEFGTGGLRGIMGAGTNRMNIYVVGAATQGFANYLKKALPSVTWDVRLVLILLLPTTLVNIMAIRLIGKMVPRCWLLTIRESLTK